MTLRNRKFLKKITPYQNMKHFRSDPLPSPQVSSHPDPPTALPSPPVTTEPETETVEPQDPPLTPEPSPPPPDTPSAPAPTEARRSTRVSRAPERLEVTGRGKSYETTTNHSIGWNLHRSSSGGEGGITGSTDQHQSVIWRPWE